MAEALALSLSSGPLALLNFCYYFFKRDEAMPLPLWRWLWPLPLWLWLALALAGPGSGSGLCPSGLWVLWLWLGSSFLPLSSLAPTPFSLMDLKRSKSKE